MGEVYYTYMLKCDDGTEHGSLYTGITTDVERRMLEHLSGSGASARYTRSHRPEDLVALWKSDDRSSASALEFHVKKLSREKKLQLAADPSAISNILRCDVPGCSPVEDMARESAWCKVMGCFDSVDMHCHAGFSSKFEQIARDAVSSGSVLFCNTVTPDEHGDLMRALDGVAGDCATSSGRIALGLGIHPWWIGDNWEQQLADFEREFPSASHLGEVGLDFGPRCSCPADVQERVLERELELAAGRGDMAVSIHSLKSAGRVMDIVEASGVLDSCNCVLHWFSGSSDEIEHAVEMGFFFSVGMRMVRSKRGREYLKRIPADKLLLETDAPANPSDTVSAREMKLRIAETALALSRIKPGWSASETAWTSLELLRI